MALERNLFNKHNLALAEKVGSLGVTVYQREKANDGCTLLTPIGGDGTVYLIDMIGRLVHSWKMPYLCWSARLLPNGNLLFDGKTEAGPFDLPCETGVVIEASWEGEILWKYEMDTLHHSAREIPNSLITFCDGRDEDSVKEMIKIFGKLKLINKRALR